MQANAGGIPICVSSDAQLASALANAQFVPTTVKIVQGHYDLHNTVMHGSNTPVAFLQTGSELLGGYTASCASRDIDVGNTVFYDSALQGQDGAFVTGDFTLEGVTWSVPAFFEAARDDGDLPAGTTFLLRRDAFIDGSGIQVVWWNQDDDVDGTIRLVDTLVANNAGGECHVYFNVVYGHPKVQMVNNTVVDNTGSTNGSGSGVCMYNHTSSSGDGRGTFAATNNIFYGNDELDLNTDLGNPTLPMLVNNQLGPHDTPGAIELGSQSGNPHLDSDYRPIESPPSPVINTGSPTAPGGLPSTDLPGRNRVVGTAPDRGAYESSINDAFLQTVTNTNDSGSGSLRSAITGAISHGSGLISFDIGSGCGPHVITLNSLLPSISVPLIINGFTQTGAAANDLEFGDDAKLCVILEAGNSSVIKALQVPTSADDGVALSVRGLAFSGFSEAALAFGAGSGHFVGGSRFGGHASGHALTTNGVGIRLDAATHDALIGSDDVADRNVIGGTDGSAIDMFGSTSGGTHNNQIINNLLGVDWSGDDSGHFTNLGNAARGIYLAGHDNEISGNWIGDNAQSGIAIVNGGAHDNTIESNLIGFSWGSTGPYGNGSAGIHLQGDPGDAPSTNTIRYNVLSDNATQGVWVEIGRGNKIRRNGIYRNGGLGIDLATSGILPNDNDGASLTPDYANRGLNYPVLSTAVGGLSSGTFNGSLESTLGDYRIDFYDNPTGCYANDNRQGYGWIGSTSVTISIGQVGGDGSVSFAVPQGPGDLGSLPNGAGITATATDAAGNTSEFSACIPYANDTIFANGFELPI
ncbi:MAG: right-handed parallel beta-helix repeat-containing protein [Dokdonella sp.]